MITITIDDFHESNHKLGLLEKIHRKNGMVFNLFVIPGLCSNGFIEAAKRIPWVDLIAHGWMHPHPRECQDWTFNQMYGYLDKIEPLNLTKGFKAPGWQISTPMYSALLERGYWVADQHYNDIRRPKELKVHYPFADHHFHLGHMGGHNPNEIELHIDRLMQMTGDFKFIKDVI